MEERANILRAMKICRFCLNEEGSLTDIYERQSKDNKQNVPLPLQLMACIAIEVFPNDGMPQLICRTCRSQTQQAYTFKSNCKRADDALKVYLATGSLLKPLEVNTTSESEKTPPTDKRLAPKSKEFTPKKIKLENAEIITLNYTDDYVQEAEHSNDGSENNEDEREADASKNDPSVDESICEEQVSVEYMEVEDDNMLNPTLTVNQVKTDCFPCSLCERSFPLKQLLDLHKINHDRERNFACDECDKSFFTKYDLGKHAMTHKDSKPFTCVVCQKCFARESLLHRHEKIHIDVPKYLCSQCDRTFLTREDLDVHTEKHRKKRPFTCRICNKSFVFKQGLERHESTHNNVKPHKCNYCEASFTSPIKLTRHVTSHAGLRPYPCKLCGRTFLLSHHLTRHMRSHYATQQSQPFLPTIGQHKCDICSMSFKRKDSLINHSAIHSMVNLKCVICNTEFDNINSVKEHITTHLTDLPYPCEKCDYSFETKEQLEDHELKHAEMEYEEQIEQEVIEEARQAAEANANEEEHSDYSGDDIAEFTITNDMDNPELVRRKSKRSVKAKNYTEFLKDECDSDVENPQNETTQDEEVDAGETSQEDDVIKPIVRSEGTKVYSRKSLTKSSPVVVNTQEMKNAITTINQTQFNSLDNLTASPELNKLPPKEIFNVKIGDKTVTVQKLLLTKEQMKAMAKEGKLEKKGNTLLLKKRLGRQSLPNVNIESIISTPKSSSVTKTYQRKSVSGTESIGTEGSNDSMNDTVSSWSIEDAMCNM